MNTNTRLPSMMDGGPMSKILTPVGTEVLIPKEHTSTARAFHVSDDCPYTSGDTRRVDKTVAEWKGLDMCEYCGGQNES